MPSAAQARGPAHRAGLAGLAAAAGLLASSSPAWAGPSQDHNECSGVTNCVSASTGWTGIPKSSTQYPRATCPDFAPWAQNHDWIRNSYDVTVSQWAWSIGSPTAPGYWEATAYAWFTSGDAVNIFVGCTAKDPYSSADPNVVVVPRPTMPNTDESEQEVYRAAPMKAGQKRTMVVTCPAGTRLQRVNYNFAGSLDPSPRGVKVRVKRRRASATARVRTTRSARVNKVEFQFHGHCGA
jgi:hypothetical protein